MFEIIMMVCLAATGQQCTEYKIADSEYENLVTCIRDSHGKAYDWQNENKKYTIIGTRCIKGAKVPFAPQSDKS